MSNYLWDKTGEAEEDLERLEELLGSFRHRPRALELPPQAEWFKTAGLRAPAVFRTAGFAVAAVLLLFVLAGALFVMRRGAAVTGVENQTAAKAPQDTTRQATAPENDNAATAASESVKRDEQSGPDLRGEQARTGAPDIKDGRKARQFLPREPSRRPGGEVASKLGGGTANEVSRHDEVSMGVAPPAVAASAPLEERQQQAKDELMYALRLAGLKLKDVQKKTQKVDGLRPAFDEQQRIR